nr:hypothetical protein [Tanacetum cinerariifolium]
MHIYSPNEVGGIFVNSILQPIRGPDLRVAASYWTAASDVAATSAPVSAGQRRSTPPATGQRRRFTMVIGGQRRRSTMVNAAGHRSTPAHHGGDWRSTTVAGGEPPLTVVGPPLTTTGPPVNGGWWAGQRPRRVEDLQLGVESYQKRLNLTNSDMYRTDLRRREAYTAYSNPRGFIYQNKDKKTD